ncbi:MAG: 3-oxoacid CoA-transferase subunit B [Proteobacteria bacterium]|nr:3-oxoacid CoA-transferase subunit B [Pseudomonadota bacterium]
MVQALTRDQMCWRVAHDFDEGTYVNLGVGLPLGVLAHSPADREIIYHSENGILGMEPLEESDEPDANLINAGKRPVKLMKGGSYFHHADSFLMIRGGHIDVCVLGAYEISEKGDLANWRLPKSKGAPAVGGAMDLAYGAKKLYVLTDHNAKDGSPKIVKECTLPLTGVTCVDRIFTDLAVIDVTDEGLLVREMIDGLEFDELQNRTGAPLRLANDWQSLSVPQLAEA